jgi:hypothetical protein
MEPAIPRLRAAPYVAQAGRVAGAAFVRPAAH